MNENALFRQLRTTVVFYLTDFTHVYLLHEGNRGSVKK